MTFFKILGTFLCCSLFLVIRAQPDSSYRLTSQLRGSLADFSIDNLGNWYLLDSANRLTKYSPAGDSIAVYNEVSRYGKLEFLDVTNPLKILLYYPNFATVVEVDGFLNILNTVDLRKGDIFQARTIGLSYDNNLWVFDELEARLKKVGDDGSLLDETTDLRQVLGELPDPSRLIDQNGRLYLFDPHRGLYLFDHYGAFLQKFSFTGWKDVGVIDRDFFGHDGQHFFRASIPDGGVGQAPIPAPMRDAQKIWIRPTSIYVLRAGVFSVYVKN